ncbi:hypothetical protein [Mesonia sp. HuA40]|uniref:hypothetical protein n=1 Tax=Mesonia sp. HuA40 TaxID=2602761 RepID=UPI0011C71AD5|nr:hypothetical protein [Mesonia sp. HuA40]TXK73954.1 hypothetical protein FT993_03590 [Mesonia sp. HuA40]
MKVVFLPKNNVSAKVCNFKWGAKAAISQCTDLYSTPSSNAAEMIGLKYNIKPTFFIRVRDAKPLGENGVERTGRCGFGVYFQTSQWHNGTTVETIPDYYSATWSSAGASAFANVIAGNSKPNRYPNHGQELYDVSGGVYGYDSVNQIAGSNNLDEIKLLAEDSSNEFFKKIGKNPSSLSYQNGKNECAPFMIDYFLFGRNSNSTSPSADGRTAYGYDKNNSQFLGFPNQAFSRLDRINQAATTRFWDNGKNITHVESQVAKAILEGGWYNDFIHYHSAYSQGTFDTIENMYNAINTQIGSDLVWRCSYGEAAEYFFLREAIDLVVANEKANKIRVFLKVLETFNFSFDKINTPISVEVDLTGTYLQGKEVKCAQGTVLKSSANKVVITTRLKNLTNGVYSFVLEESAEDVSINLNVPTATKSVNGDIVTITTDLPTKAVLFSKNDATAYNYQVNERINEFSTEHIFDISNLTGAVVGFITANEQSNLIQI